MKIIISFLEALAGSSSTDLLGSTSGYHSYEPSPFNHRSKRSSLLDPSAAEFHMETEQGLGSNRSSYQNDQQNRRSSRSQNHSSSRIATSCKYIFSRKNFVKNNFFLFKMNINLVVMVEELMNFLNQMVLHFYQMVVLLL